MQKRTKYLIGAILFILIVIQFVPVERQNPVSNESLDLLIASQASEEVQEIIRNSCYDCHSNNTVWPWYSYVAPVSFVIAGHVVEGRDNLNFSEWGYYEKEDQISLLKHIKKEIEKNGMPLSGYVKLHADAELTLEHKALIIDWIDSISID